MARSLKLYNHSQAPNPRRVRIFAAEKGIEFSLEEVDILAGQSRTPEFLAKNSSGAVPVRPIATRNTRPLPGRSSPNTLSNMRRRENVIRVGWLTVRFCIYRSRS
jgi:hypothetical protein